MLWLTLAYILAKEAYDMDHIGLVVVVTYSYFLYCNRQTSIKTQWVFKVITLP